MKVTVEVDCTPEEARKMLGLPDVQNLNERLVKELSERMKGATSLDQLQNFTKVITPMGEAGLKLFGQFLTSGVSNSRSAEKAGTKGASKPDKKSASKPSSKKKKKT